MDSPSADPFERFFADLEDLRLAEANKGAWEEYLESQRSPEEQHDTFEEEIRAAVMQELSKQPFESLQRQDFQHKLPNPPAPTEEATKPARPALEELQALHENYRYQRLFYDGLREPGDACDKAKVAEEFQWAQKRFNTLFDCVREQIKAAARQRSVLEDQNTSLNQAVAETAQRIKHQAAVYTDLSLKVQELRHALSDGLGHRMQTYSGNYDAWDQVARGEGC